MDEGNAYHAPGLAGLGVLAIPCYLAEPNVASGELIRLFPDWNLEAMPVHIAYPQNRHLSTRVRVFIDWVSDLMGRCFPTQNPIQHATERRYREERI